VRLKGRGSLGVLLYEKVLQNNAQTSHFSYAIAELEDKWMKSSTLAETRKGYKKHRMGVASAFWRSSVLMALHGFKTHPSIFSGSNPMHARILTSISSSVRLISGVKSLANKLNVELI
jgi:hypothetical protein